MKSINFISYNHHVYIYSAIKIGPNSDKNMFKTLCNIDAAVSKYNISCNVISDVDAETRHSGTLQLGGGGGGGGSLGCEVEDRYPLSSRKPEIYLRTLVPLDKIARII